MSALPSYPAVEPYLVQIGDIGVTQHWVVTPRGSAELAGSEWFVGDRAVWSQAIPVWAIVLAVVLFPIGLLFLLVKEPRLQGWREVTITSGQLVHVVALPVGTVAAQQVPAQVEYVRQLSQHAASS